MQGSAILAVVGPIVAVVLLFLALAKRYRKVGPNQVMIISGLKHKLRGKDGHVETTGFRIRKGGGAFIIPLVERVDILSLEVMTLDFTTPEVYTKPGVPIVVDGVAQVKIKGDESSIRTAAEQFLGKGVDQLPAGCPQAGFIVNVEGGAEMGGDLREDRVEPVFEIGRHGHGAIPFFIF